MPRTAYIFLLSCVCSFCFASSRLVVFFLIALRFLPCYFSPWLCCLHFLDFELLCSQPCVGTLDVIFEKFMLSSIEHVCVHVTDYRSVSTAPISKCCFSFSLIHVWSTRISSGRHHSRMDLILSYQQVIDDDVDVPVIIIWLSFDLRKYEQRI